MQHEYEATFLAVDTADLRTRLEGLGAVRVFPRTRFTRRIFEGGALEAGAWVRLRDEGTRSTLTLKQVTDATAIDGTTEVETEVGDPRAVAEILERVGLRQARYQENDREEWRLGEVVFDFDTWPGLPTFLEVEGPDEDSVRGAAALLGLDYARARFGSVDEIYRSEAGRDILAEPVLLFADAEADPDPGAGSPDRTASGG
ncbi:class IV adenylate cyclase [Streptomonospora nanhaiensis]|uniref:Adenylate cyclase class 2 n=1 Tax=Streptomonospora nanhaiensis TaxID=1323731 RepID=A0A853BKN2_9ACTN|nr:CYTH domain-containing protein [Streptomonospora nanhaiensis]MBV2365914.1 CYTH domain-containing protein [Streptomonospora nanhaiensis]MBX9388999.1 CYTH domain-containing protein [Streptomonospora nanhaiensis]NYI95803.1 adenylate cyclase class 2 [Streptomonospora nanhaiensis]